MGSVPCAVQDYLPPAVPSPPAPAAYTPLPPHGEGSAALQGAGVLVAAADAAAAPAAADPVHAAPAAAAPQQPLQSMDDMLDELQHLLEGCGVEGRLLCAFEVGFPGMPPSRQRHLFRSLVRAVGLGDSAAVEQLIRQGLQR